MKYAWLEKYAEDGLIRPEALKQIYADTQALVKEGASEGARGLLDAILGGAIGMMTSGGIQHGLNKLDESAGRKALLKAREDIAQHFGENADKARARFDEIASFAPHVAMNAPLAQRIISTKLENALSDADTQALAIIQAQHMPDAMRTQNYIPKLAGVRPEVLGDMVADVYLVKEAAFSSMSPKVTKFLKSIAMHTAVPLLIGAGGGVLNAALAKLDQRKLQAALDLSFQRAIDLSSDHEPLRDRPEKARQAFNSLVHFAPHVALEPQAARAFMSKIVAFDQGMNVDDVRALVEIQKNVAGSKKPGAFAAGVETAGRFTNTPGMIQKAVEQTSDDFVHNLATAQMSLGT